jgi:GTP cyclohydrolase I
MTTKKRASTKELIHKLLLNIGENPERQGLLKTPKRVEAAYDYLTQGYKIKCSDVLNGAIFNEKYDEMVLIKDIDVFSLCEHHLLPFYGKCHVAYIPKGRIIGLSKIPRIVDLFARRLQVQERLTTQISESLMRVLDAQGVAVIIEASHLCMMMRGVEKQNSYTITSSMLGVFHDNPVSRAELMNLLGGLGRQNRA